MFYRTNFKYRHGSHVSGLHRQKGPSCACGHSPASLRLPSIHQLGAQWRNDLHLALVIVGSFYPLHLRWYRHSSYPLSCSLVSNKWHFLLRYSMANHHPCRAANGHSVDELPFKAAFGVYGSWVCLLINVIALMAQFYVALYPIGGPNLSASTFFQLYLAGPLLVFLYLVWKIWSWFVRPADRPFFIKLSDIDIYTGMRDTQSYISGPGVPEEQRRASIQEMQEENKKKGPKDYVMAVVRSLI